MILRVMVIAAILGGCAGVERAQPPGEPIALTVDGRAIPASALWAPLAEAAGSVIVEEAMLDAIVARCVKDAGITIDDRAIERERELLLASITNAAGEPRTHDVLERVLTQRGIGPARLGSLLRRSASLRELVRAQGLVHDESKEVSEAQRALRERLAMDQLANDLVAKSRVHVLDPALGWSWDAR
jgi:hypothetical protein